MSQKPAPASSEYNGLLAQQKKAKKAEERRRNLPLYLFMLPGLLYLIANNYIPMFGILIAFNKVNFAVGIFQSPWCAFDNFEYLFVTKDAWIMIRNTLDITWEFVSKVTSREALPENAAAESALRAKLSRLNIGNPLCQPFSPMVEKISGRKIRMTSGCFTPFAGNFMTGDGPDGITEFRLDFDVYGCVWNLTTRSGRRESIRVSTGGTRFTNLLGQSSDWHQLYLYDGWWPEENVFQMHCRWLETCLEDVFTLTFDGDAVRIEAVNNAPFPMFGEKKPITAVVERPAGAQKRKDSLWHDPFGVMP